VAGSSRRARLIRALLEAIVTMLETGVPLPTVNTSKLLSSPGLPLQYQTRIRASTLPVSGGWERESLSR
jgi:hypothetical protein